MRRARSLASVALLVVSLAGCGKKHSDAPAGTTAAVSCTPCEGASPVVDPTLLAFLSKARAAHHRADLALEARDQDGAIRALEALGAGHAPPGRPSEVAEVMADTHARLADLRSGKGDFDAAERELEAGLALAVETTHFRGHLIEVRGLVEERRSRALAARGELEAAERARKAAVAAYEAAIAIQDQVIADALESASEKPR
ncbi:hypothetical protein [Chondromyces crocatus]|uniref:Uncharacterized protein n=1 Tax=Chondromyces crocatus TaxID=52 RepID=A0A0K1EFU1_CHOCO|nr:hypothetical protein [Chondromyces crocatus]AKT39736.1 uncharacterized protein CMC5_038850 [Chondromyces crocatus]